MFLIYKAKSVIMPDNGAYVQYFRGHERLPEVINPYCFLFWLFCRMFLPEKIARALMRHITSRGS